MQSHFFKMFETILAKDIDAFESYMHPEFISVSEFEMSTSCLLYTSPSPRDQRGSRMPSSA